MSNRTGFGLAFGRKTALAIVGAAAVGAPILVGVLNVPVIQAQSATTAPAATTPEFDVVLVEPIDSHRVIHNQQDSPYMPGGHFSMQNTTVRWLLVQAYGVPMIRCDLKALPDWANTTHYTIEAKPAQGFPNLAPAKNIQQIKLMLQAMLADRFKVTLHHETRETPAYEMTLAKDALKNVASGDANQAPDGDFNARNDMVHLAGKNVTMSVFGDWISQLLGRSVIDKTGLNGVYNFDVLSRDAAGTQPADGGCDVDCRSLIIGALSDHLGLKLRAITAPDDFLVLDHIEKPRPN